jgi:hypothetical protein
VTAVKTEAEQYVAEQLQRLLRDGSRYRVGALLLTYDGGEADGCRIAHGIAMHQVTEATAVDCVQLVKGLRYLADELDKKLKGGAKP